jgi:protein gp37
MGENSSIAWTHHTFNPWIGCHKISPACKHCYAAVETFPRVQRGRGLELWGADAERHVTSDENWRKPIAWNRAAIKAGERHRVFCASLSDVFEHRTGEVGGKLDDARARLWKLIEATPQLDWLLLTKRPENAPRMMPEAWLSDVPENVWVGTTVEDQEHAQKRIPMLRRVPAAVHFLSVEPMLGPVVLDDRWLEWLPTGPDENGDSRLLPPIRWVIAGAESGPHARGCDVAWIRSLVEQCKAHPYLACFVKQLGAHVLDRNDTNYDGVENIPDGPPGWPYGTETEDWWREPNKRHQGALVRFLLEDRKGGNMEEWPPDLRVRQFPEVGR